MNEKNKLTNSARYKKNGGITLIALVITIIVMLILAAISINIALNGGLFEYAGKAGKETRLAALEEQLYTAYMSEIMADYANGTNNASLANAIAQLNLNGEYVIESIPTNGANDITLAPATTNIVIGLDDVTNTYSFTVTPAGEGEANYYVVEGGKYYKINYNENGKIEIDRNPNEVNSTSNTISVEIEDETIATASITGDTVTITGTKTKGNTNFTLKYGNNIEKNGTIKAKEPTLAFRTYGEPVATGTTAGTYGTIGTRVYLGPNNTQLSSITVSGTNTIEDNWLVFYEDDDFIYLIYGDYYPVNVQTNSDISTLIFGGNGTYDKPYGLSDSTSGRNLLKYLRNNSAYTWNETSPYGDNHGTNGTTYASWNNLKTALNTTAKLKEKKITIQGSPDMELWVKSWNAKGNTKLKTSSIDSHGYIIGLDTGTMGREINLSTYNTAEGKDYNDTLYFPYKTSQPNASGYMLASPGWFRYSGNPTKGSLAFVTLTGYVCSGQYVDAGNAARPVIAIEK